MPDGTKTHWLEYVKQAAINAIKNEKPCDYIVGTVVKVKPLKIRLSESDGLDLTSDFIHQTATVYGELKKNDKVLLIRKWGGQDYIIVDKVVN